MSSFFAPSENLNQEPTGLKDFNHNAEPAEPTAMPEVEGSVGSQVFEEGAEEYHEADAPSDHEDQQEAAEPASGVEATPRAQRRIKDLARQKRELTQQNAELQSLVEQLRRQADLAEKNFVRQQEMETRAQEQMAPQVRRQRMLEAGLNPANPQDQFLFDLYHENERIKGELTELQTNTTRQAGMAEVESFHARIASSLQTALSRYDVDPETVGELFDSALETAYVRDLTAEQAAHMALQRFHRFLKPRQTKRPDELTQSAIRATSIQGRSGGKTPGVQNQKPRGFNGYLDAMFGGRR